MIEGPQQVFRDPGFGLFYCRDSGFLGERGARFGIVYMNGTRDLGILQSEIREISLSGTDIREVQ